MKLKEGVIPQGLTPEILLGIIIANDVFKFFGHESVITSLLDSKHSHTSLHYCGNAVDFRVKHVARDKWELVTEKIKERMTPDYDVILESDHIHIEYQPKR